MPTDDLPEWDHRGMYAVATFLVVATLTLAFTRVATGALVATGVPHDVASFQARSAFSGAGFTTVEAESVVNHPLRRRIIATTMFVGNLGTPTLIVTVLIGFLAPGPGSTTERGMVTFSGLLLLFLLVINKPLQRVLSKAGQRYATGRLIPHLESGYSELLSLGDGYVVGSVRLAADAGDTYRSLRGLNEAFSGLHVLGVRQGDRFIGMSPADVALHEGDELVLFGPRDLVEEHSGDAPD